MNIKFIIQNETFPWEDYENSTFGSLSDILKVKTTVEAAGLLAAIEPWLDIDAIKSALNNDETAVIDIDGICVKIIDADVGRKKSPDITELNLEI